VLRQLLELREQRALASTYPVETGADAEPIPSVSTFLGHKYQPLEASAKASHQAGDRSDHLAVEVGFERSLCGFRRCPQVPLKDRFRRSEAVLHTASNCG
jgi:hypothetical protein